jgi:hypothetical protein
MLRTRALAVLGETRAEQGNVLTRQRSKKVTVTWFSSLRSGTRKVTVSLAVIVTSFIHLALASLGAQVANLHLDISRTFTRLPALRA